MALRILRTVGIDPKKLYSAVVKKLNEAPRTAAVSGALPLPHREGGKKGALEEYTRDLTEAARAASWTPSSAGRDPAGHPDPVPPHQE